MGATLAQTHFQQSKTPTMTNGHHKAKPHNEVVRRPAQRKPKTERGPKPKLEARRASRGSAPGSSSSGGRATNRFLYSCIRPSLSEGTKIPDDNVMPSFTVQTVRYFNVSGNSTASSRYWVFSGNFLQSVLLVGTTYSTGEFTLMKAGNADLPSGNGGCVLYDAVTTSQRSGLESVASDIRFVSGELKWVPMASATNNAGIISIGRFGRGQWPAQIDDPNGGGFSDGLASSLGNQGNGFSNRSEFQSACVYSASAARPTVATLFPQDEAARRYRAVPATATGSPDEPTYPLAQDCSQFNEYLFENEAGIDEVGSYYLPAAVTNGAALIDSNLEFVPGTLGYYAADINLSSEQQNGWIGVMVDGIADGVTLGRLEWVCNWECLPRQEYGSIVAPTSSPSDPIAMSHADNVLSTLPPAFAPDMPSDPNTLRYQRAAKEAAPSAPAGSWLKEIGGLVKDMAPLVMAAL
jgi:hypothetical protein